MSKQIAYVTSIGEPTTDLCVWALERQGYKVITLSDPSSLAVKLKDIYSHADENFLRVDADVIVNRNVKHLSLLEDVWWVQYRTFDWFKQDLTNGGVQLISNKALPYLRDNIDQFIDAERPESQMFRLDEFENPRRCITEEKVVGIHGYRNDIVRVRETKERRGQLDNYDFELAERLNRL